MIIIRLLLLHLGYILYLDIRRFYQQKKRNKAIRQMSVIIQVRQ